MTGCWLCFWPKGLEKQFFNVQFSKISHFVRDDRELVVFWPAGLTELKSKKISHFVRDDRELVVFWPGGLAKLKPKMISHFVRDDCRLVVYWPNRTREF